MTYYSTANGVPAIRAKGTNEILALWDEANEEWEWV